MTVRGKHVGFWDIFQGGGSGGSSIWVRDVGDDPYMGQALGIFQNRVARRHTERHPRQRWYGSLEYPPLKEVMEEEMWEVGLDVVEVYILKRNNKVMGTREFILGRGARSGSSRGGRVIRGGRSIGGKINRKLAWGK